MLVKEFARIEVRDPRRFPKCAVRVNQVGHLFRGLALDRLSSHWLNVVIALQPGGGADFWLSTLLSYLLRRGESRHGQMVPHTPFRESIQTSAFSGDTFRQPPSACSNRVIASRAANPTAH